MTRVVMDRDMVASPRVRFASVALMISIVVLLAAVVRAIRIDPLPASSPATVTRSSTDASLQRGVQIDPEAVVQADIFAIDRIAPTERYPMPGEGRRNKQVVVTPPAARPVILGTAVGIDGAAFATVQLSNTPSRIVRVGDKVGVFRVIAITRGTVTFRVADEAPFQVNAP